MNVRGFTLVEMVVCIAIFAMMTALLVAKYGTFNQSVLLTDLAYDTAITVRTAQTYGLGVQSAGGSNPFNFAYGVDFSTAAPANVLTLFADNYGPSGPPWNGKPDGMYESGHDLLVSTYTITRGATVSALCVSNTDGSDCVNNGIPVSNTTEIGITFKRPNPDAIIFCVSSAGCVQGTFHTPIRWSYARIFIKGTDGSIRSITVRDTGQISVQE